MCVLWKLDQLNVFLPLYPEVGIANFFLSPLIANPLIFFLSPLNANPLIFLV